MLIALIGVVYAKSNSSSKNSHDENPLLEMRKRMLLEPMQKGTGIEKSSGQNKVYGVLMEMGFPKGAASLVALLDGTTSLYFETSGGIIGGGEHENVRRLTIPFVEKANDVFTNFEKTNDFPLPKKDIWAFYVLTENGVFTAKANGKVLKQGNHPLSDYAYLGNEVITQMRIIQERDGKPLSNEELLLDAVRFQNIENTQYYLKKDIEIDKSDETGLTPLMAAAYLGNLEILNLLAENGANIEKRDEDGYTALTFAANAGKLSTTRRLIELGADVNAKDKQNSIPVMFAAQHGHNEIVKILLENGADPEFKGTHGLSAIGFAEQNGLKETEKILKEYKK